MGDPVRGLRMEPVRDYLAPAFPFVRFYVGEGKNQSQINLIPDFLEEYHEKRFAGETFSLFGGAGVSTGGRIAKFILFDPSWDFLENAILPNKNQIKWEIGWVGPEGDPDREARSGLRHGHVIAYKPTFTWQGNRLEIEVVDQGGFKDAGVFSRFYFEKDGAITTKGIASNPFVAGGQINQQIQNPDSGSKVRISDVVQFLADEMGLESRIEPTKGKFGPIAQVNETHFSFIERVLKPLAATELDLKDYEFRIEGLTLIFQPPAMKSLRRRYWFSRDQQGTMMAFQPIIDKNAIFSGKWASVASVGFSPLDKKTLISEIDMSTEGKEDKDQVPIAKETFLSLTAPKSTAGRLYVTPYDDASLLFQYTRAKHREIHWVAVRMRATIIGDPLLSPHDLIDVVVLTDAPSRLSVDRKKDIAAGNVHYASGVYRLVEVTHRIQQGGFITEVMGVSDGHRLAGVEQIGNVRREFEDLKSERVQKIERGERIKRANAPTIFGDQ